MRKVFILFGIVGIPLITVASEFVTLDVSFVYDSTADSMRKRIESAKEMPLYLRISWAQYVVELLNSDEKAPLKDFISQDGKHDLLQVRGRAAYALDLLWGSKLPTVNPNSTVDDSAKLYKEGKRILDIYRSTAIEMSREYRIGVINVQQQKEFRDKLEAIDRKSWRKSAVLFHQLLVACFPIGKKLNDLEQMLSIKSNEGVVLFEDGHIGVTFSFRTQDDGTIVSVFVQYVE